MLAYDNVTGGARCRATGYFAHYTLTRQTLAMLGRKPWLTAGGYAAIDARLLHGFYSQPAAHDVRGHPWCQFADFQRPLMYWPSLLRPPAGHALRPLPAALDARLEGSQLLFATRENNRRVPKLQ